MVSIAMVRIAMVSVAIVSRLTRMIDEEKR